MSAKNLKKLIEQAWRVATNGDQWLYVEVVLDPEYNQVLLVTLNAIPQFIIYPKNKSWTNIKAVPYPPLAANYFEYYQVDKCQKTLAIAIVLLLLERFLNLQL